MRGIQIVCVGKIKEAYFKDGIDYYVKNIRRFIPMEIVECPDEPTPEKASASMEEEIRRVEGQRILQKIKEEDYVVTLCIDGKHYDTASWIRHTKRQMPYIEGNLVFVIGGSLGLSKDVIKRGNEALSFSNMTFPHQMMRMILCEQVLRIFSETT